MSKQTIYVRHKDEILNNLINSLDDIAERYEAIQSDYESGYITALKWVLGLNEKCKNNIPIITGDRDTDALLEDERKNQNKDDCMINYVNKKEL